MNYLKKLAMVPIIFVMFHHETAAAGCGRLTFKAEASEASWDDWMGHAWVVLECETPVAAWGFYPGGEDKAAMWRLSGEVGDDEFRTADVSYTFDVGESGYTRAKAVIEAYRHRRYIFPIRNCKDMVAEVASAAGLRVPSGFAKSPAEFVGDLIDANAER